MGLLLQLRQAVHADKELVGLQAKQRAALLDQVPQPFTLILSASLLKKLCEASDIQSLWSRLPEEREEQIKLFTKVTEQLRSARLPTSVIEPLRESFELVTLDTSDLKNFSQLPTQKRLLSIIPSPSYETTSGQQVFIADGEFRQYLEQIKSCIASFFTPEAIELRRKQDIQEWSLALLAFRLPQLQTCFEVVRTKENSVVQSYIGLPDIRHGVEKDEFRVEGSIPKIVDRNIKQQTQVCVYAKDQNQVVVKDYTPASTSLQSAPEYDILEASRLAKKCLQETESIVEVTFVKPKQGTMVLLELKYTKPELKEVTHPEVSEINTTIQAIHKLQARLHTIEEALRADDKQTIMFEAAEIKKGLEGLFFHEK